jgi:hypothetical protein
MSSAYINSTNTMVAHKHFSIKIEFIIAIAHNYSTIKHATTDRVEAGTEAKNMLSLAGREYPIVNSKEFPATL